MSNVIDITDLDKAAVLASLFNASAPQGLGFLQAGNGPQFMSVEDAQSVIAQQGLSFQYLFGRPLKVGLQGDQFRPGGFDSNNGGEGTAQQVIDRLRATGEVNTEESKAHHDALLEEKVGMAKTMVPPELLGTIVDALATLAEIEAEDGIPVAPKGMTPRRYLNWASDQALAYYDKGSVDKAFLLFGVLVTKNPNTAWIAHHEMTSRLLHAGAADGRSQLEYMMKGFTVSDTVSV